MLSFVVKLFIFALFDIGILFAIQLLILGEFRHYIDKRKLLPGDLVIIKYRAKYRRAFIKYINIDKDRFQLEFEDRTLNTKLVEHNWYPIDRIILPEYMGKAGKVLFSEMEKK